MLGNKRDTHAKLMELLIIFCLCTKLIVENSLLECPEVILKNSYKITVDGKVSRLLYSISICIHAAERIKLVLSTTYILYIKIFNI